MTWRWKLTCALACVVLGMSLPAEAQRPAPTPRIGFLGMDPRMQAEGRFERLPELAAELVAIKVDVIVTAAPQSVRAAQHATSTIPIVITAHDPVGMGFIQSLAHVLGRADEVIQ